jgi:hypothetical protein
MIGELRRLVARCVGVGTVEGTEDHERMNGRTLFSEGPLREHLAHARAKVQQALLDYNPDQLLFASEADLSDYLVGLGTVQELVLHRDEAYQLEPKEITKQSRNDWDRRVRDVRVTRYTVVLPFSGDPKLLRLQASTFTMAPPYADIQGQEVHLYWDTDYGYGTAAVLKSHFDGEIQRIERTVGFSNNDIAQHNKALMNEVPGMVSARRAKHMGDKQLSGRPRIPAQDSA